MKFQLKFKYEEVKGFHIYPAQTPEIWYNKLSLRDCINIEKMHFNCIFINPSPKLINTLYDYHSIKCSTYSLKHIL